MIEYELTFTTEVPLTQEQGRELWGLAAEHFGSVSNSGGRTYSISSTIDGDDIGAVVNNASSLIRLVVGAHKVIGIEAKVIDR